MIIKSLKQTKSIAKTLTLTVVLISTLFLLEVVGLFFGSQNLLQGLTDLHKTIQIVVQVRNLKQVIATEVQLIKESSTAGITNEEQIVIQGTEKKIDDLFSVCLELSNSGTDSSLKEVNQLILDAQKRLIYVKGLANEISQQSSKTQANLLLIDQFVLEMQDLLGKVQIVLAANSDTLFDRIYQVRFVPIIVAVVLSVIFLIFALWMGYRLKNKIDKPIQNLIQSTQKIADGNLKSRATIFSPDEIGLLAQAFNLMAANLEQSTFSRGYVESILESMFNCVLVLDEKGIIQTVNRLTVQTFGYSKDELIGLSMYAILHDDVELLNPNSNLETEAYTRSGNKFSVLVSVALLDEHFGLPSNLRVCVVKDISESKKLENKIKERNLALNAANQELEAFSYSVSHDLRAPLRIIDGFSQALVEDARDQLSAEAKGHLSRIRAGVQKMGQLIDAVLNISRLTRANMVMVPVDLTAMAKSIAIELRALEPDRKVKFFIHEGLKVTADQVLIKITLENLLGNAWKYTSKNNLAKIEFGKIIFDGLDTFFIKDNGVGFDMAYAKKLFTPFQRLHSQNEFPGTGIGLASVKRVIHRHGGTVWVESELDKGTTFYFTLARM